MRKTIKLSLFIGFVCGLIPSLALAGVNLQSVATTLNNAILDTSKLAEVLTYFTGSAYAASAAAKYKKHFENPQFIPLSMPVTETLVSACLLAFPSIASQGGHTIFEHHYVNPHKLREQRLERMAMQNKFPEQSPYPPAIGQSPNSKAPSNLVELYTR